MRKTSRLVFRGGLVVDEDGPTQEDLVVEDGVVVARGAIIEDPGDVVDCSNALVLPGLVDMHVHLDLSVSDVHTADDVASGTRSALAGGVTTLGDFAEVGTESLSRAVTLHRRRWHVSACDWVTHVVLSGWSSRIDAELHDMAAEGVARSVKVFTTYRSRGLYLDDEGLYRLLESSAAGGFVVLVHAENDGIICVLQGSLRGRGLGAMGIARSRPPEAEEEAVGRVLLLARHARGRVHLVHLSCAGAVARLAEARARAEWASGETCPHYLVLTDERLAAPNGHWYATSPPLRTVADTEALWGGLARGDVQIVATDSCGFSREAKDTWDGDFTRIPGGMPGVETSLRVMYEGVRGGRIRVQDLVRAMSGNPARLLGVYPRKGCLGVGSDADIVVLDPSRLGPIDAHQLISKAAWSPFDGFVTCGPPRRVYLRGRLVAMNGMYVGGPADGRELGRAEPTRPL